MITAVAEVGDVTHRNAPRQGRVKGCATVMRMWGTLGTVLCLMLATSQGALVDTWRAADLAGLNDGDSVDSWTSTGGRTLRTTTSSMQPRFYENVTPAGGPVVRFDQQRLRRTDNSPVAGLTGFSIAVVFRLNDTGSGSYSQWYNNTGLVDAEQGGVTADWGTCVTGDSRLGWGIGQPDQTVYLSDSPSLVDSTFHTAIFTWGDSEQAVYLDNKWMVRTTGATASPRNNAGLAFGRLLTDVNPAWIGELVEVRFYDTPLTGEEATNAVQELMDTHITPGSPVIESFTASTNQILINSSVTLSWKVGGAADIEIQPGVGLVTPATGSLAVSPRTNTTYTLTASNSVGSRSRQVTVVVDQLRPTSKNQSVTTLVDQSRAIALTGSDPQGSPLTYRILTGPSHGVLAGTPPNVTYTPVSGYVGNDQFTFAVNDGEFDSTPGVISIQVLAQPTAPSDITISTTNINSGSIPGSFIASFNAIDPNPADTHSFSLVPGFGSNSRFLISSNALLAGDAFAGTQFIVRVRATDSTSLWTEKTFNLSVTTNAQSIVINEVHYNPEDNTVQEEFVELYNPTAASLDVSGWELSGGMDYVFPVGSVIAARGFLVVAQDPPTIQSKYGVPALGPWSGGLSSEGEEIRLENAAGQRIDLVDYTAEFPWPISPDGAGASAALVNPSLSNELGSSWRSEFPPTPGRTNGVFALNAAPNIRQVNHTPLSPASTNRILITAKVTDPQGVRSVQLEYQLVFPGSYLPVTLPVPMDRLIANIPPLEPSINPAYTNPANWSTLPMTDTGVGGDALAGDDIYSVTLPAQPNRVLVRYRVVVTDATGLARRAPFEDDVAMNFGCYVYDGVPDYQGTPSAALQTLPLYTLVAREQDIAECTAYNGAYQIPQFQGAYGHPGRYVFNWPGTLVYDGRVYENIHYRLRGANGRYQPGKRNWRFELNRGNYFTARDQFGRKFPRKWSHITAGKGSNNRLGLTFGLNEVVNYFLWNKVGVPAPESVYFHFRVVDAVQEAPDRYTGDFWGLNWAQEDYDGAFLDTHGLAKGNLYKLINATLANNLAADMVAQQRYQASGAVTNGMDGAAIQTGLLANQTSEWIRARVNCEAWYRYHVVCEAVRHYDTWPEANKNAAWYFEPPYNASNGFYGRFWTLPWDTDSTWGATWNNGYDLVYNGIFLAGSHPDLQREYRNTARELRDLLFQPDQVNPVIDAMAARIAPFVPADLARWSNAPASGGNYVSLVAAAGFATPALTGGIAGQVKDMKEFMFTGGTHPWWIDRYTVSTGGWITRLDTIASDPAVPSKPVIYYVGQTNFPMNSLTFECLPFSDPQGAATFAGMQWRLAEVRNTNNPPADPRMLPPLEWDPVWESGTLISWTNRITFPGLVVDTNRVYRARVRHLDNSGRWSKWSDPAEFSVTSVDLVSVLRQNLRFSEIMYNPPDLAPWLGDDLEFLELKNIGGMPLNLGGLTFSSGITFTFTNGTVLGAGQRLLLGRNVAALQSKYPGITVHGVYSGRLDNAGETLRLSAPNGMTILDIAYEDSPPWPVTADGMGWSLVLDDALTATYRPSVMKGGSPGADEPVTTIPPIVISELLTHTDPPAIDAIELFNPTASAADISGWFLTDQKNVPKKFRVPSGTLIQPGGHVFFDQSQYDATGMDFNLSSLGDEAYLFSADAAGDLTGYVHGTRFGAAENGVSLRQYLNSVGAEDFVAATRPTLGTNNAPPRVGPIVISEIMFQPGQVGTNENYDAEFIELHNLSAAEVPLFDTNVLTNTWRLDNAVDYSFPTNLFLSPGGRLLVVGFDPATNLSALAAFRSAYSITPGTPIVGPWSGRLNNAGETIELKFADKPEPDGFVPYIMVEKVSYSPRPPWDPMAAGTGLSLQRKVMLDYANDPVNWFAALPTPGALSPQTSEDADGDGMPDSWETLNGTDPLLADGELDPDDDHFDNYAEWVAGTNPRDATSYLALNADRAGEGKVLLSFEAVAARSYTVLSAPLADAAVWFSITNIPAAPTNRPISILRGSGGTQFYRLVTPAEP